MNCKDMSNTYFKFKQFTIYQDKCAMKVGTDGVLLGAWADCNSTTQVLDIGTGTGLIALMIAQRSTAFIDAIEIDEQSCNQAKQNVEKSPWRNRINITNSSFQEYHLNCKKKYDLIITNPPYFSNSLQASNKERTLARHNFSLSFNDLFIGVSVLLTNKGLFSLIIPTDQYKEVNNLVNSINLYIKRILWVKPTIQKSPKRVLLEYSLLQSQQIIEDELTIEEFQRHKYSDAYIKLTRDFYLAF